MSEEQKQYKPGLKDYAVSTGLTALYSAPNMPIPDLIVDLAHMPVNRSMKHISEDKAVSDRAAKSMSDSLPNVKVYNAPSRMAYALDNPGANSKLMDSEVGTERWLYRKLKLRAGADKASEMDAKIKNKVTYDFNHSGPGMHRGASFRDGLNRVNMGKVDSNAVLVHELGHAISDKRKSKAFTIGEAAVRKSTVPALGVAAYMNVDEDSRKYAPLVAALPGLATLREEGAANYHAAKHIHSVDGLRGASKFIGRAAIPQMTGYLGRPAAMAGGTYMAGKMVEKMQQTKQAEESTEQQYTPHYLRNAALAGASVGVPIAATTQYYAADKTVGTNAWKKLVRKGHSADVVRRLARGGVSGFLGATTGLAAAGVATGLTAANHARHALLDKKASWREGSLEALRDFGVISAADLAAMALHEKFNRGNTDMSVEHPENVYLQKVAEQLEQEKQANLISSITNGAKTAWGGVKSVAGDFAAKNPTAAKHVTNAWDKTQAFATKHPIATSVGASVAVNKATS